MTYFILTKNGRANRRLVARLKAIDLIYSVEKIAIGQYVYTFTDPDKAKWKTLKDILGTDEKDFIWNDHE